VITGRPLVTAHIDVALQEISAVIEDPPLLQIRRNFTRPDRALLARFVNVQTEHLADAMGGRGALDFLVKPVDPDRANFTGSAVTSLCGPGDNLALVASLALLQPGDVIVAATDAHSVLAVVGRRVSGMARNRGAVAVVTDGLARDAPGIRASGVPVFCRGITPNSATAAGPGTVGQPVVIGGVAVQSGDIVVGDADGVVVVPLVRADEVLIRLEAVRAREADLAEKLASGLGVPRRVTELLGSPQVKYLD
jgi:4-hydroxy-4-methyl-2-oxoglutarate aldolase